MLDHGEYVWLVDLNKDGKQDILLQHPTRCREATHESPRVMLLIAR